MVLHFYLLNCLTSCLNITGHFYSAEDSLFIRSIIVTEGSILVCIEDLDQFGGVPDDSDPAYFYLDASCSIRNVLEVVSCAWVLTIPKSLVYYMIISIIIIFIISFLALSNKIIVVSLCYLYAHCFLFSRK